MIKVADSKKFVEIINSFSPSTGARLTIFNESGHDAWTRALNPTFRESGKNIYEWMLQHKR